MFSIQNPILGYSLFVENMYADKGIIPTVLSFGSAGGPNLVFLSYAFEKESRKSMRFIAGSRAKFYFSVGAGIAFNRSIGYYKEIMIPDEGGGQYGDNYYAYDIRSYRQHSLGVLLPFRSGINIYNRQGRDFLILNVFWNQGTINMATYNVSYEYGYVNRPEYQRTVSDLRLKSRGTTFGVTVGVPITILNKPKAVE